MSPDVFVFAADPIRNDYGRALMNLDRLDNALVQHQADVRLQPGNPIVHRNYPIALGRLGRLDESAAEFKGARRLEQEHAERSGQSRN